MKRRFLKIALVVAMAATLVVGPCGNCAQAGFFKKLKKGISGAANTVSNAAQGAGNVVANQVQSAGGVINQADGKIEGAVTKGFNITVDQLKNAASEVEDFSEDSVKALEKFAQGAALAIYREAVKPVENAANKTASGIKAMSGVNNIFLSIGKQLAAGNFDDAVATTRRELANSNSALKKFIVDNKPFGHASLIISADLSMSASGLSEAASIGLAIDLEAVNPTDPPKIIACVFVSVGFGVGTPAAPADAGVTIGFMKGKPQNCGGQGINLTAEGFSFGFPLSKSLVTNPSVSSLTYSVSASDLVKTAATAGTVPPVKTPSLSMGFSSTKILQSIRSGSSTTPMPSAFTTTALNGSTWNKQDGSTLVLVLNTSIASNEYDFFDAKIDGSIKQDVRFRLRKGGSRDNGGYNAAVVTSDAKNYQAMCVMTDDGNELTILPTANKNEKHLWYRYYPDTP